MKVRVLTDTTLTVKAGQTVEVLDAEVPLLIQLGRAVLAEPPQKKKAAPKKK